MSNLPNDMENVQVYNNEYVSSTTLNRPLSRLHANDQYLESIIKNYINKPILPFIDSIYPSTPFGSEVSKCWCVGDANTDRAITLKITLDDGENYRYSTFNIINNNNTIAVSENFHETPHIVSHIKTEFFIDAESKIQFKLYSTNSSAIKIVGEISTTLPKRITTEDASRYAFYMKQNPELFENFHSHNNLELLDNIKKTNLPSDRLKFLNKHGEYIDIILNHPTEHNHINYELLDKLEDNTITNPTTVFNNLVMNGDGDNFLGDDGEYHPGNIHIHTNLDALNNIINTGGSGSFLNAAGLYTNIDVGLLHPHENKAILDLIENNTKGNIDILNNLINDGDEHNFLNEKGEYKYVHEFENQDQLDLITSTGYEDDKLFYLSKSGTYEDVGDIHTHTNKNIIDSIGSHSPTKFLNGKGEYIHIKDSVPCGGILQYTVDFTNEPDPPEGYFWCDGATVERSLFSELYQIIGVYHGNGDGILTFTLPEIQSIMTSNNKEIKYMIKYTNDGVNKC